MAWDRETQKHTLFIENHGTLEKPRYKLAQFKRLLTAEGTSYLEPRQGLIQWANEVFDDIRIVEPLGTRRDETAAERTLTRSHFPKEFGYRAP